MPHDTQGSKLKLKYAMQIKVRPPTFFVFCNRRALCSANFEAYLRTCLAKEFGYVGVPIRILLRDARTQYGARRLSSLSVAARSILSRIKQHAVNKANPTRRRRVLGNKHLYTKGFRAKSYKKYKRY